MGEDSQFIVPASFIALYTAPGRPRPWAPREEIAQRYDFCEDLAQMLTEPARNQHWELGITETDVLERIGRGLAIGIRHPRSPGWKRPGSSGAWRNCSTGRIRRRSDARTRPGTGSGLNRTRPHCRRSCGAEILTRAAGVWLRAAGVSL
jgi:hypothetical protein